jgi:hypothetical protein
MPHILQKFVDVLESTSFNSIVVHWAIPRNSYVTFECRRTPLAGDSTRTIIEEFLLKISDRLPGAPPHLSCKFLQEKFAGRVIRPNHPRLIRPAPFGTRAYAEPPLQAGTIGFNFVGRFGPNWTPLRHNDLERTAWLSVGGISAGDIIFSSRVSDSEVCPRFCS